MAEGGIAAARANVDARDSWEVHFADTMRGGQYVNNWRMAELHAKEAPERVRELEAAPRMGGSYNGISVDTSIRDWPTWVTAPAWR